jgi:hypothetical protein
MSASPKRPRTSSCAASHVNIVTPLARSLMPRGVFRLPAGRLFSHFRKRVRWRRLLSTPSAALARA